MLVERLKEACDSIGWNFNYGRGHWQNLNDFPDDSDKAFPQRAKYFLLLWKDRDFKINDYGAVVGYSFEGEVVLCVRSKISDKDYNFKYEEHIKNLEIEAEKLFEDFTSCEEWTMKRWKEIEVENEYDINLDGLKVRFTVEFNIVE